jgi:hypothetical protein
MSMPSNLDLEKASGEKKDEGNWGQRGNATEKSCAIID